MIRPTARQYRPLIVSLIGVVVALAKSGGKSRRFLMGVQMGDISEGGHAEKGSSFPALLCHKGGHGGRSGAGCVPQHHGGDAQKMADKHAAGSEVAEEDKGIVVGLFYLVAMAFPYVPMVF